MSKGKTITVSGVAFWASVQRPNMKQIPPQYEMQLVVDEKTEKMLKAEGLNPSKQLREKGNPDAGKMPKSYADQGHPGAVFTFRRKLTNSKGDPMTPPKVVDAATNPTKVFIGNGSKVNVSLFLYDYDFQGKTGTSAILSEVQVVELVEFKSDGSTKSSFTATKGFTDTGTTTATDTNTDDDII